MTDSPLALLSVLFELAWHYRERRVNDAVEVILVKILPHSGNSRLSVMVKGLQVLELTRRAELTHQFPRIVTL